MLYLGVLKGDLMVNLLSVYRNIEELSLPRLSQYLTASIPLEFFSLPSKVVIVCMNCNGSFKLISC